MLHCIYKAVSYPVSLALHAPQLLLPILSVYDDPSTNVIVILILTFFFLDCCVFLPGFWNIVGTFILNSLSGNSSNLFLGDMCDAWGFYYFFFMWLLRFYCALYIIYSKWFVEIM